MDSFEDFGLEIDIYSCLIENMMVCEYKRSRSFFDLWPVSSRKSWEFTKPNLIKWLKYTWKFIIFLPDRMNFYETCQPVRRSSVKTLWPRILSLSLSLSFFFFFFFWEGGCSFKHLLKATGSIVTKFHVEPPWAEGTKICLNGPSDNTDMACSW